MCQMLVNFSEMNFKGLHLSFKKNQKIIALCLLFLSNPYISLERLTKRGTINQYNVSWTAILKVNIHLSV